LFDLNREVKFAGTVTGVDFVNPHSYVYFDATGSDGTVTRMRCEMRAATVLRRSGWSADMFIKGARIEITGHPHRDDSSSCYVETLAIGNAPALERYQQLSERTQTRWSDRPLRLPSGEPNLAGEWAQEQYLLAHPPGAEGPGRLVPKSLLEAVNSGKLKAEEAPDAGWRPATVTLTEAGKQASAAFRDLPPDQKPNTSCQITSILFDWVFDGPINRITQSQDQIVIEYGRGLKRIVHMNLDRHPEDITPSRAGHSIGRWDGDTLVVDTIGFEPGIVAGTVPHSGEFHVIERFTLDPRNMALKREYTAEDPLYFADQYIGADTVLPADAPFNVDQCKELAHEYMTPAAGSGTEER
jgi:hypothetical protein